MLIMLTWWFHKSLNEKKDSFPTKYRPDTRSQIAVCDLVIAVCDLTILYQMPEGPQETFLAPKHSYGSN